MKVLFIAGSLGTGGASRQFLELVHRIPEKGITPIVCTLEKSHKKYADFFDKKNIKIYALQRRHGLDWKVLVSILDIIKKENISLIQTWQPLAGLYGVIIARLVRKNIVCSSIRDANPKRFSVKSISIKIQAKLCNVLISNTRAGFDVHFKKWRKNFKVITNGIDFKRFDSIREDDIRSIRKKFDCSQYCNIIMAANLRKNKDPFTLIQAAAQLIAVGRKIKVFIIGEGEIKNKAEDFTETLGIKKNVYFLGYKQNIETYIAAFDIAVLLAETRDFQEGISNFLLEAMALKKIVIATNGGGNIELIEHGKNGYLVNPYDIEDLRHKLELVIEGDQKPLIDNAYDNVVLNYSMAKYINSYYEIYKNLGNIT